MAGGERTDGTESGVERALEAVMGLVRLGRDLRFHERFNDGAGVALSSADGWIIWLLHHEHPYRPADLGSELGLNAPAVTKAIARLEQRGYVVRERHPDDQRSVLIRLTPEGRAAGRRLHAAAVRDLHGVLSARRPEDVDALVGMLDEFAHALRGAPLLAEFAAQRTP